MPDLAAIVDAAHRGRRAGVRGRRAPRSRTARSTSAALGCDALVTSPYKWYGPHAGVLWLAPDLRDRPHARTRCGRRPTRRPSAGRRALPSYEAIAATAAAAPSSCSPRAWTTIAKAEQAVFAPLLDGLLALPHVRMHGPRDLDGPDADGVLHGRAGTVEPGRGRARGRAGRGVGRQLLRGRGHGALGLADVGRGGPRRGRRATRRPTTSTVCSPRWPGCADGRSTPVPGVRSEHDREPISRSAAGAGGGTAGRGARRGADRRRRQRPAGDLPADPALRRAPHLHDVRGAVLAQAAPHQGEPEGLRSR